MKTRLTILAVLLLLFCLAVYHVRYVPLRKGYLRVSFSLRGYQTNEEGQVTPMFTISNGGPHVVYAGAGTESRIGPHRVWYNIPRRDTLNPGDQVSVSLEPPTSPESRLVAYCERVCTEWPLDKAQQKCLFPRRTAGFQSPVLQRTSLIRRKIRDSLNVVLRCRVRVLTKNRDSIPLRKCLSLRDIHLN
jgi:hypothetical protein